MSIFCPNVNSTEYQHIEEIFGESISHLIWSKNNGNPIHLAMNGEPSKLYEDLLTITGSKERATAIKGKMFLQDFRIKYGDWLTDPDPDTVDHNGEPKIELVKTVFAARDLERLHNDERVQEAINTYGRNIINDWNNPYAWDLEKKYKTIADWTTVNNKKTKIYQLYDFDDANIIAGKVLMDGGMAKVEEAYSKSDKRFRVKVGYTVGLPTKADVTNSGKYSIKQPIYSDKEELEFALGYIYKHKPTLRSMMDRLRSQRPDIFMKRPDLDAVYNVFLANMDKVGDRTLILRQEGDYFMQHNPVLETVEINKEAILDYPSMEAFIQALVHEMAHAFTSKALKAPTDAIDYKFLKEVTDIYNQLHEWAMSDKSPFGDVLPYGLNKATDMVSEFLANPQFAGYLKDVTFKSGKPSLFKRIISAVVKFFTNKGTDTDIDKETLYDRLEEAFSTFINTQTDFEYNPFFALEEDHIEFLTLENEFGKLKGVKDMQSAMKKAFLKTGKMFNKELYDKEHKYLRERDENGDALDKPVEYTSVTKYLSGFGYGPKEGSTNPLLLRGAGIGSAAHYTIEGQLQGTVRDIMKETGYGVNKAAEKQISEILEQFRGEDIVVLSEVMVADPFGPVRLAGTIDLIVIDERGRVHLYDFKTKENKGKGKPFKWYTSKKFGESTRKAAHVQLTMYKHIIEKNLGIPIHNMNVVMLEVDVNEENMITRVALDDSYTETGIDTFHEHDVAFSRLYKESKVKFGKKSLVTKAEKERKATENSFESKEFTNWAREASKVEGLEALLEKTKEGLKKRLEIMRARYSYMNRAEFDEFYNQLEEEDTTGDAFLHIIDFAHKKTEELWEEMEAVRNSDKPFTPQLLYKWRDYLMAYDTLDELNRLLLRDPSLFGDPDTLDILADTINKKNSLKDLYTSEGKYLIAEWLTPYFNGIRVAFKESLAEEYRRDSYKMRKKEGLTRKQVIEKLGTEEEYIEEKYGENKTNLDKETYNHLYKELTVASRDVNDVTRWLDNMLDTPDSVAAAMVNAFVEADEKSRLASIKKRTEIKKEINNLMKHRKKGNLQGEKQYYEFLLELDKNGEPTQYLLKPWKSEIFEEERKMRAELIKEHTEGETKAKMSEWRAGIMRMTEEGHEAFRMDLDNEVYRIFKEGGISEKDYILIQDLRSQFGSTIKSMVRIAKDNRLSENTSEFILSWINTNSWYYYQFEKEYQSPQWNKLMKRLGINTNLPLYSQIRELRKSEDPEAKFYNYIDKLAIEIDKMLPYSFRLGYRLPGVAKLDSERIKEGQDPLTFFKETVRADFLVRPEDTERGSAEFTDEQGNIKYFLPIHYTAKLEPENQSYDVAGIYYRLWDSANDYVEKRNILANMEMAKSFVEERRAIKTNSLGDAVERIFSRRKGQDEKREPVYLNNTNTARMLEDWMNMALYGKKSKEGSLMPINDKVTVDVSKVVDAMNRYTSLALLGFNVVQGTANVMIGEVMQAVDAFAHEHVSAKSLTKGTLKYTSWLPGMMGDIGLRTPEHVGSLLVERFNILHDDPTDVTFSKISRIGQLMTTNSLFFMQKAGEHWMQSRFLFAMLAEKEAFDREGKSLGSMLDQYYAEDGELKLKEEVDESRSKWTKKDQVAFMRKTKGLLSRMHGEYSDLGRVAIQRMALGRMAYMFRKFVIPGYKRRWQRKQYIERLGQTVEGNYRTTMRFAGQMFNDLKGFKLALMAEDWAALSDHEKANIRRTVAETAFVIATIIMAGVMYSLLGETDDDDDERLYAFFAYQAYRLRAELLFWSPKLDEAMSILRSPMAAMSIVENLIKLTGQVMNPLEEYERGPWKGEYKIKRTLINFVPIYKQYYKLRDIEEQINWFR